MGAVLQSTDDTRSPLQKYTRKELEYIARMMKRDDIAPGMPADLMRRRLENTPPPRWPRPMSMRLGQAGNLKIPPYDLWLEIAFTPEREVVPETVLETNVMDDLERQWANESATPAPAPAPVPKVKAPTFQELKKECKAKGLAFKRTDNKAALTAKLEGVGSG